MISRLAGTAVRYSRKLLVTATLGAVHLRRSRPWSHGLMIAMNDYGWFEITGPGLSVGSCLTFVRGRTSDEVAHALGGSVIGRIVGLDDLDEHNFSVAVTELTGGALIVEQYSQLGTDEEILETLSQGTDVATVYHSEHNDELFIWAKDGDVRVSFDFRNASWREGSEPDALLDVLRAMGFNLGPDDPDDPDYVFDEQASGRAFDLAEHVTGVRLTEAVLTSSFSLVRVPALA
ncbi:DUF6461 domain-containing protein [Actinoplanes sp. NPDC048796]|uniref:DUF6461 domain-containing protein n=1 Tax=Actinoplanes sp. NPDC048796 TaxID=3155640 RepID=UPI0033F56517